MSMRDYSSPPTHRPECTHRCS